MSKQPTLVTPQVSGFRFGVGLVFGIIFALFFLFVLVPAGCAAFVLHQSTQAAGTQEEGPLTVEQIQARQADAEQAEETLRQNKMQQARNLDKILFTLPYAHRGYAYAVVYNPADAAPYQGVIHEGEDAGRGWVIAELQDRQVVLHHPLHPPDIIIRESEEVALP